MKAIVLGAGGFIGHHLVNRLKEQNYEVIGVDLKLPEFSASAADSFLQGDLRDSAFVEQVLAGGADEIYQLAADMGGAGYIFTGDNDADVMQNSAKINLNVLDTMRKKGIKKVFYSSSACVYPEFNQEDPDNPVCTEHSVYPAQPDSEYGWEKLFSERLFMAYARNYGFEVRIARFHNVFGPEGAWNNGKEKAPAAICRKVAMAEANGTVEIWGDGKQTRSFLYIEDCLDGVQALMKSTCAEPVNIGSEEMISINHLVELTAEIAGKQLSIRNIEGPVGVRGRCSDNRIMKKYTGWEPQLNLRQGMMKTYHWINQMVLRID